MIKTISTSLLVTLSFILILHVVYQHSDSSLTDIIAPTRSTESQINGSMTKATILKMNERGQLEAKITVNTIHHIDNGTSNLTLPHMTFYGEGKSTWEIMANRGITDNDMTKIHLQDHVIINQYTKPLSKRRTFKTKELFIFPDHSYAMTDQHVTMIEPNTQIEANGLRVDLKTDKIELISQIKGKSTWH